VADDIETLLVVDLPDSKGTYATERYVKSERSLFAFVFTIRFQRISDVNGPSLLETHGWTIKMATSWLDCAAVDNCG
jgi:hypothetical protein